ncbi:MAG: DUF2085 domain-containing protein [Anaerolineae bacterium]|nr:DUF2085 domain-containing protein [Anaerolineae bacterium]
MEAERRRDIWTNRITFFLTRFMRWFSAHWLLLANVALVLYLGLPLLAPWLMHTDHEGGAKAIYLIFRPLCHQLPERSYFLFGARPIYSYAELSLLLGTAVPPRYIGSPEIGFKVGICQRCVSIYGSMLLAGLLFGLLRRRLKALPFKAFLALILPLGIDGVGQLLGFWESSWISRTITGGLFGLACVWLPFPYLETGMREVHEEAVRALERMAPNG